MLIPPPETFENPGPQIRNPWVFAVLCLIVVFLSLVMRSHLIQPQLLTDPFLLLPSENAIRVVWFTEFPGLRHTVTYGESLNHVVTATTTKLSRTREDRDSRLPDDRKTAIVEDQPIQRDIWRHEAEVTGLRPGMRVPYQVISEREDGHSVTSRLFTLTANPAPNTPLKILLTSDHQLMPMTAANLQKVVETVGQVDAVFLAGDLVNIPDRASEWFDEGRGRAFFPCLQGRAASELTHNGVNTLYKGGEIIQHAPLFPAIGNHEVMGRFSRERSLDSQFNDAIPYAVAETVYTQKQPLFNPDHDPLIRADWLKNNSFNTDTYSEIFNFPNPKYYAVTLGDVRLVVLYITTIWRTPNLDAKAKGRYREREEDFNHPESWGYGNHIFEPISPGSPQHHWLVQELNSPEFKASKYKVVMFHHPPHTLGDNSVPAYTDPVQIIDRDAQGNITRITYEYPKPKDYIIQDVVPLLEAAGVHLVFYGHSHLWNRFISPKGLNFLETSNVGNTYGAYIGEKRRPVPVGYQEDYSAVGDPNGLTPIVPTLAPLFGAAGEPLPYIASNEITVFSILETGPGKISSYYFDTRNPNSDVVKFDEFLLNNPLNPD